MQTEGNILKMRTEGISPVQYFLPIDGSEIQMNTLVGKQVSLQFTGQINCISCGKQTKTSFGQGFCYNCLQTSPKASESVVRPELSKAHFGIARDMEWASKHDLINHHVYFAVAGDVKVGVTRHHQVPTRWIDQGASFAIKIATTPNRHIAGVIEVYLKKFYSDKTDWRDMLKNEVATDINLLAEKEKALGFLPAELRKYSEPDNKITIIEYPVVKYPLKVNSLSFDKQRLISGILQGIKGQYLIFEGGEVLNIRKHSGYFIQIDF